MKSSDLPDFYKDFGPDDAIDQFITRIGTICYTIQLGDNVRVLCLNDDKNENNHAGYTPDCWKWIEKQIKSAQKDNCVFNRNPASSAYAPCFPADNRRLCLC